MRNLKSFFVATVLAVGLVAGMTSPAQAASAGAVAFVGTAVVTPLWYPVSPANTLIGSGECNPLCPQKTGTWSFTLDIGAGAAASTSAGNAVGTASGTVAGDLHGSAVGGLGAWCGLSGGSGGGGNISIANLAGGSATANLSNVGWPTSAATIIPFIGDASVGTESGVVAGVVSAIPIPTPGNSCADGQGSVFTVVGAGAFATV